MFSKIASITCTNFLFVCVLATSGCTIVGAVASKLPDPMVEAQYTNLAGQPIAVMAWADRGIRIDWPTLQLDLAGNIQRKLAVHTAEKAALAGATFPVSPQSIARFQEDHPSSEFEPIENTATKLGVTRLIYVEVDDFSTRADSAGELFRGVARAGVKVVEVPPGGPARVVYEERDIVVTFPPDVPAEGTLRGSDSTMYVGTISVLATRIENRFVPYTPEDD